MYVKFGRKLKNIAEIAGGTASDRDISFFIAPRKKRGL